MYCGVCCQESVSDKSSAIVTGEFRKETLKLHHASRAHQKAMAAHNATTNSKDTPPARSVRGMKKETMIKMCILFEGVYLVTKREQSLRLYPDVCTLLRKTGASVGNTYWNDKAAHMFVGYIADESDL